MTQMCSSGLLWLSFLAMSWLPAAAWDGCRFLGGLVACKPSAEVLNTLRGVVQCWTRADVCIFLTVWPKHVDHVPGAAGLSAFPLEDVNGTVYLVSTLSPAERAWNEIVTSTLGFNPVSRWSCQGLKSAPKLHTFCLCHNKSPFCSSPVLLSLHCVS